MAGAAKARGPWARLLCLWPAGGNAAKVHFSRDIPTFAAAGVVGSCCPCRPTLLPSQFITFQRHFSAITPAQRDRAVRDLLAEVEREKQREREEKRRAGEAVDDDEEEEDFMGVGPLIEKWEKRIAKETGDDEEWEIPTDSDSDDDERFSPQEVKKRVDEFEKKHKRHEELLLKFAESETLDEAHKWMTKIDKFEQKYLRLPLEYKVIGDLMNRLKNATGKENFFLQHKLNRAVRLMDCKEAYDPNNPANYGVIRHSQVGPSVDQLQYTDFEKEKKMIQGADLDEEEDDEFNDTKEEDNKLLEKLNAIDKKLEEKLAELDHTFGKKGRVLEQEIKELAEERNALTEKSRRPLYRKGFDVKVIDVNRTCKVTKGGQLTKYTALLACGNLNGVIGFAKAKGPAPRIAIQKAYEKCFQNLHYVERHEEHTIAHAVQTKYEKTKIYLWPAPTRSGVVGATKTVQTILYLAGFKNVKSKVIGSRNPHNTIKALFKALNAIETPKDIQEKFGRTVVESYLL
uniref:30S ribosomal protein S5 n=1 Tax=Anthurium amnicola TaxID=1678845 RepID=A0A1D1XJS3_9ARAE